MGTLSEDMRRVVEEQRLGYAATVCHDGTPNLSPKGTIAVWDDHHLIFAGVRSPRTTENLRHNPAIEINVVDPISRKGYRFKGTGTVLAEGSLLEETLRFYRGRGVTNSIRAVVLVEMGALLGGDKPGRERSAYGRVILSSPRRHQRRTWVEQGGLR